MAGVTAFATKGIAAGLSTAFTYLAATKLGMLVGLAIPSIPALTITAEVILAAACGLVAGALPAIAKVAGNALVSLSSSGFEYAKSFRSNAKPETSTATTPTLAALPGQAVPGSVPTSGILVQAPNDTYAGLPTYTPAATSTSGTSGQGSSWYSRLFSVFGGRSSTPAVAPTPVALQPVFTSPLYAAPAQTPYFGPVPVVVTTVAFQPQDGQPDPAAGTGLGK